MIVGRTMKKIHLKTNQNSLHNDMTVWLGNTKPKKAFRLILNAFKKLLENFKKIYLTEFSTD